MRIAYFTDTPEIGGAERNLADMANAARDGGCKVMLLAPQDDVIAYLRERVPGAAAIRVGSNRYHQARGPAGRAIALAGQVGVLRGELRRVRPDVLHVNNGGFPGSDLCRIAPLAGRMAGVPARVMSVHTVPWSRDYRSTPAVQAVADRVVWAGVDAVVCPSRAVMDGLLEGRGMPRDLVRPLHYGVVEPVAPPGDRDRLRARLAPGNELLVGMVSNRAVAEKGYDVFVDALSRASGVRGVVVGPHPGAQFLERIERGGVGDRLALEGPQRDVGAYYDAMDVLAVPSTAYECMPLVILEAMAVGTPAAGSQLSGIPEAIVEGETGRTFPPGDAGALAEILVSASSSRGDWERMGRAARTRWEREFTWEKMRDGLLALYAGLVAGRPGELSPDGGRSPAGTSSPTDAERARRAPSA